jgi:hypothetical protein
MANIKDTGTHFTYRSKSGSIGDSFFFFPHWYGGNFVLVTLLQGKIPSGYGEWLDYLVRQGIEHEVMGRACLIMPGSTEQLFLDERSFTGGSEIYICHKRPEPGAVPRDSYPADDFNFNDNAPDGLMNNIRALDALAYLSDGQGGINIVHKMKEEIIFFVKEMSMGG